MSSPILPAEGLPGLPSTTPATDISVGAAGAFIAELDAGAGAPSLEATRGCPPSELLDEILAADELAQQLCESGYQLRFFPSSDGQRTRIELHDADGSVVSVLTAAQAVAIAEPGE
jgi:hypothetical protein